MFVRGTVVTDERDYFRVEAACVITLASFFADGFDREIKENGQASESETYAYVKVKEHECE